MTNFTIKNSNSENAEIVVIDLTSGYKIDRSSEFDGIWLHTLTLHPELLTTKAKRRIALNLLHGRGLFTGMGRIPRQAEEAYKSDKNKAAFSHI